MEVIMNYIKAIESRLSEDKKDILKRIYEPTVIATPLFDSRKHICILPDGEIRSYGKLYAEHDFAKGGQIAYLSSKDAGLSWEINYSNAEMNSCIYLEKGNIYITTRDRFDIENIDGGLYVLRSTIGPDDKNPEIIKISDDNYGPAFFPMQSEYSDRIWFCTQLKSVPVFFFSDDLGKNWKKREISVPPEFNVEFPHKGKRWSVNSNSEPCVVEIAENELMMIIRTPLDCFYASYSHDRGNTWTDSEPTTFYGTNTTAYLLKLSDGRIINFWNNTKPMPEQNYSKMDVDDWTRDGIMEYGFTNRDIAHAAISEDGGKTFTGYREILLNPVRNNADFRYAGGKKNAGDRSVHQFQAFELPFNKVLVSAGQNVTSRRLIIFDINWLYETQRSENFINGMENITVHTYLKSVWGCQMDSIGNGHCAWNRTYGAYLMPDPDDSSAEALMISKHGDDRLYSQIRGMCWNFPMSKKGKVSVKLNILEKQARFILTDRWYNTCDVYSAFSSPFWFELDTRDTGNGYCTADIEFDTEKGIAKVCVNNDFIFNVKMTSDCPTGISYLIMQCATDGDSKGFYIKSMQMHKEK